MAAEFKNRAVPLSWETAANPSPADVAVVDEGLGSFNGQEDALREVRPLTCFARSAEGQVVGGIIARTWGRCCELQQIWVDEQLRRSGIGRCLVQLMEEELRRRGCSLVYLETFSFQSPACYHSLGFELACEFTGFPNGIVKHVMRKTLDNGASE